MYRGDFATGSTIRFKWNTSRASGASVDRGTNAATGTGPNGTIRIYKDSSTTERSSSSGITDTEDFDSVTGVHHCAIDLSDNTDAGFYAAGHDYQVCVVTLTVDGQAVNAVIAEFSIQNRYSAALDAAGTRTALGLASANLDTQLGAIDDYVDTEMATVVSQTTAAAIRSAVGLASANLDTQIGTTTTQTTASAIRTAVGLASANLDTQLGAIDDYVDTEIASILVVTSRMSAMLEQVGTSGVYRYTVAALANGPTSGGGGGLDAAGVRAALGMSSANLDTQLGAIDDYVDTEMAAVKLTTDHLATMFEQIGTSGVYRYTVGSLANVPTGITAAGVRTAVGLASANLDTQLGAIDDYIDTEMATAVSQTTAAAIRSAMGLASANLDTQLSTVTTQTTAASLRSAVGLASANLDTQLGAIDDYVDSEVATIVSQTTAAAIRAAIGMTSANLDTQLTEIAGDVDTAAALFTTQLTESYATLGAAPTPAQALFMIQQMLCNKAIVGTTLTVKKKDGTTTAGTFTLNSSTFPTSIARAS